MSIYNQSFYMTMVSAVLSFSGAQLSLAPAAPPAAGAVTKVTPLRNPCCAPLTELALAIGLLTSGQLVPAVRFVLQHPRALGSIFALSMAATTGEGRTPLPAGCLAPALQRQWHLPTMSHLVWGPL